METSMCAYTLHLLTTPRTVPSTARGVVEARIICICSTFALRCSPSATPASRRLRASGHRSLRSSVTGHFGHSHNSTRKQPRRSNPAAARASSCPHPSPHLQILAEPSKS